MKRVCSVVAGIFIGLLLLPLGSAFVDPTDWRGREMAEWCNYYRAVVKANQELAQQQMPEARNVVGDIAVRTTYMSPWLTRCAIREITASGPDPGNADVLLAYLDQVMLAIPVRNPEDPDDYPAPLEDPSRLGFGF